MKLRILYLIVLPALLLGGCETRKSPDSSSQASPTPAPQEHEVMTADGRRAPRPATAGGADAAASDTPGATVQPAPKTPTPTPDINDPTIAHGPRAVVDQLHSELRDVNFSAGKLTQQQADAISARLDQLLLEYQRERVLGDHGQHKLESRLEAIRHLVTSGTVATNGEELRRHLISADQILTEIDTEMSASAPPPTPTSKPQP